MELHETSANAPPELVEAWLKLPETRTREFKRVSGKMVGKALESLCAFANGEGGMLVLGLGDAKEFKGQQRLFGIEENPEALDELRRKLGSEFSPPLGLVHWQKLSCTLHNGPAKGQPGHLVFVRVGKSDKVHSLVNNGT
jgi:ATP-dependent DNA helicase RecG